MSAALETTRVFNMPPLASRRETPPQSAARSNEAALVSRAQSGDTQAFEDLVRTYRNDVYAFVYRFVRNREDAWDLAQETFIKAYRALGRFRGEASFKTWILRIAANQSRDHLRRKKLPAVSTDAAEGAPVAPVPEGQHPDAQAERNELSGLIEEVLEELPFKHRTVFILREFEGLSYEEIAQAAGCRIGTVMSRLYHARRKMREALAQRGIGEDAS